MIIRLSTTTTVSSSVLFDAIMERMINGVGAIADSELGSLRPSASKVSSGVWDVAIGVRTVRVSLVGANMFMQERRGDGSLIQTPIAANIPASMIAGYFLQVGYATNLLWITSGTGGSDSACCVAVGLPNVPQYDASASGVALFTGISMSEVPTLSYIGNGQSAPILGIGAFALAQVVQPSNGAVFSKADGALATASSPYVLSNAFGLCDPLGGRLRRWPVGLSHADQISVGPDLHCAVWRSSTPVSMVVE